MLAIRRGAVTLVAALTVGACGAASDTTGNNNGGGGNNNVPCTTTVSMSLGQVLTNVGGSSLCVAAGSAHQEFMMVPFYGRPETDTLNSTFAFSITGQGLDTASVVVPANLAPLGNLVAPTVDGTPLNPTPDRRFEQRLRTTERRELPQLFSAARAGYRAGYRAGASFQAVPGNVALGTLVQLNSNALQACSSPQMATGRVMAVTQKAIVVADTANPLGGYTASDYQSIGVTFDTLVYPMDTAAFGGPSDIDNNGRVILFFTKAVNNLTPKGSGSYVGGFFFGRDLFPTTQTTQFGPGCTGSNYAEMFYLMVPDTSRSNHGENAFSASNVTRNTIATTAHEFQHLINAARRLYVNTSATDFEIVWLNEGLSHVAEELLFYRVSGLSPRQNIDSTQLLSSPILVGAFNAYEVDNFGRYHAHLSKPAQYGPYTYNDSLETRGATWALLRYLADHHGTSDGSQWYNLVNSTTEGVANLRNNFGSDVVNQIRDWAISNYTDDLQSASIASTWQQPSWNYRSVMQRLFRTPVFPIFTQALVNATPLSLTLDQNGGAAYVRFATKPGTNATISWATPTGAAIPAALQMSVVRVK